MGSESVDEYRKIEFDTLYKEIAENSTRIYAVFGLCVTATTAAIAILMGPLLEADSTTDPGDLTPLAVLVLPAMIILPCMLLITGLLHSTVRIAGYIAVFFEQPDGARWQSRVQAIRELRRPRYFFGGMASVFSGLALVTVGSSVLAMVRRWGPEITPVLLLYLVAIAVLGVIFARQVRALRRVWDAERFREFQQAWTEIRQAEQAEVDGG